MPTRSRSHDLLNQVASAQAGLVTSAQLAEIGVRTSTVSRRSRMGGMWNRVLPSVHLVTGGQPDRLQREFAAQLYAGASSVLTGITALRHYEPRLARTLWLPDDRYVVESVHVLVDHSCRRTSVAFVEIERTRRLPERSVTEFRDGLVLAPPARAVSDAARRMRSESDVRELVIASLRLGLANASDLTQELKLGPIRGSAFLRSAIEHAEVGVWSPSEGDLRDLFSGSQLPEPMWNPRLVGPRGEFIAIPDAWFDEVALAIEVDSREHHSSGDGWERTLARQARYAAAGVLCIPVTPRQIREQPERTLLSIEEAYETALARPRPLVRAIVGQTRAEGRVTPVSWAG
ncbi:MAG: hypothetical protein WCP26_05135 [Actinomycetes bacterium]